MWRKEKRKRKHSESQVFRPPLLFRALLLPGAVAAACFGLIIEIGLFARLPNAPVNPVVSAIWVVIVIVLVLHFLYLAFWERLVVSSGGIEFHIGGTRGFATWDNVVGMGYRWSRQGIFLYRPICIRRELPVVRLSGVQSDFIPLEYICGRVPGLRHQGPINGDYAVQTELGEALLQYAPHLFEGEKLKHEADA